jgi:hypothetical protein
LFREHPVLPGFASLVCMRMQCKSHGLKPDTFHPTPAPNSAFMEPDRIGASKADASGCLNKIWAKSGAD